MRIPRSSIREVRPRVAAERIDPAARTVTTSDGDTIDYDRLLIATGPRLAFEKIAGLGPHAGHTQSVCNLDHALLAADAWVAFLENPGPVVIGTARARGRARPRGRRTGGRGYGRRSGRPSVTQS